MPAPTLDSLLDTLAKPRLVDLGRILGVGLDEAKAKEQHVATPRASRQRRLPDLVGWMHRDELRGACEKHGIAAKERARPALAARLPKADRAALQSFEDEVMDRLFVLNAERAKKEAALGRGGKKSSSASCSKAAVKTAAGEEEESARRSKKAALGGQGNLGW